MADATLKQQKPRQEQQNKKKIWEAVKKIDKLNIDLEAFYVSTIVGADYNYTKNYINRFKKNG